MGKLDDTERRIDLGCAATLALLTAVLFLALSIWVLPWPFALLIVVVLAGGLFEAKRRWGFDIWGLVAVVVVVVVTPDPPPPTTIAA